MLKIPCLRSCIISNISTRSLSSGHKGLYLSPSHGPSLLLSFLPSFTFLLPIFCPGLPPLTHWTSFYGMVTCLYDLAIPFGPNAMGSRMRSLGVSTPSQYLQSSCCLTASLATPMTEIPACSTPSQPHSDTGHQGGSSYNCRGERSQGSKLRKGRQEQKRSVSRPVTRDFRWPH